MLIISRTFFRTKDEREAARLEFEKKFARGVRQIAKGSRLLSMDGYTQHGNTSTLLHDYFLYDWHERDASHSWHGFTHPGKALGNASADFVLTDRERDIIRKHMFPLTPAIPKYRESVLVCLVDKWCSTIEVFRRDPYADLRKFLPAV